MTTGVRRQRCLYILAIKEVKRFVALCCLLLKCTVNEKKNNSNNNNNVFLLISLVLGKVPHSIGQRVRVRPQKTMGKNVIKNIKRKEAYI